LIKLTLLKLLWKGRTAENSRKRRGGGICNYSGDWLFWCIQR